MDFLQEARRVIADEVDAIQGLSQRLGESFVEAVALLQSTIESGQRIAIVGVGKSGNIGRKLAATFNSTGAPCVLLNAQDALHGDLGLVRPGDAVLALSASGETAELLDLLPHLKEVPAKIIGVTGRTSSSLARASDVILDASVEKEACPLNLAPTSSTTVTLVLGDALAMVLLSARGFGEKDFARLHPSGTLGKKLLLRARDLMRPREEIALVSPDDSIQHALERMNRCRCGAAIVADKDHRLLGIFTHGDFARSYASNEAVGREALAEHMTTTPLTIDSDLLASEIRTILEDRSVDDIVVLDEKGQVAGLVDTVDLTRIGL